MNLNPSQIIPIIKALQLTFSEKKQWKDARRELGDEFRQMSQDFKVGYDVASEEIRKERLYQEHPDLRPPKPETRPVFNWKFLLILVAVLWLLSLLLSPR
jgi:hypothetical protein